MYLSKITITPNTDPYILRTLGSPYEMHRTICRGFPQDELGHVLFRYETTPDTHLLVQSQQRPNWDFLTGRVAQVQVKEVNQNYERGQRLAFRLRANPVLNLQEKDRRFKQGITDPQQQLAWLQHRGEMHGFTLKRAVVRNSHLMVFMRKNNKVTHVAADFEGVLEVTDPQKFQQAIEIGIGPAKYSGLGMLCALPIRAAVAA